MKYEGVKPLLAEFALKLWVYFRNVRPLAEMVVAVAYTVEVVVVVVVV